MRALPLLLLLLAASTLHAQSYRWIAYGEASWEDDYGRVQVVAMAVDSSDHPVVLVKRRGLLILIDALQEIAGVVDTQEWGSFGYMLVKYTSLGDVLWVRNISSHGGEDGITINDLCVDSSGAIYLTGGLADDASFSTRDRPVVLKRSGRNHDRTGFAVKYGDDGRVLWAQDFPTLPPCDRIGTDGDSTLYLLMKGRQGYDGPPIVGLHALDSSGKILWTTTGPRIASLGFAASGRGSAYISVNVVEPPKRNADRIEMMDVSTTTSVPSLARLPTSEGMASLTSNSRAVLRFRRDGMIETLFTSPYPGSPTSDDLLDIVPFESISFDAHGDPFFASLISSGRPDPFRIGGKEMREKPGQLLLATLDRSATLGPMRWFPMQFYNATVQRLADSTWLVSGPLIDSMITARGVVRSQPHESSYVRDVVWMQLDSNLNPMWALGGGGTSNYQTSLILPARNGSFYVASTVVGEAQLGRHLLEQKPRSGMFYVARINAP